MQPISSAAAESQGRNVRAPERTMCPSPTGHTLFLSMVGFPCSGAEISIFDGLEFCKSAPRMTLKMMRSFFILASLGVAQVCQSVCLILCFFLQLVTFLSAAIYVAIRLAHQAHTHHTTHMHIH